MTMRSPLQTRHMDSILNAIFKITSPADRSHCVILSIQDKSNVLRGIPILVPIVDRKCVLILRGTIPWIDFHWLQLGHQVPSIRLALHVRSLFRRGFKDFPIHLGNCLVGVRTPIQATDHSHVEDLICKVVTLLKFHRVAFPIHQ